MPKTLCCNTPVLIIPHRPTIRWDNPSKISEIIIVTRNIQVGSVLPFSKYIPFRFHFWALVSGGQEFKKKMAGNFLILSGGNHRIKKLDNLKLFKSIKIRNHYSQQTNSGTKILELFHRTQSTTSNTTTQPHSNTLHSMTKIPPVPTPLCWVFQIQVHRSRLTAPYWTIHKSRTRTLCTNFLPCLLTLQQLIGIQFSMLLLMLNKLKNWLELNKTGHPTHLPGQTIREQIPCFPIRISLYVRRRRWISLRLLMKINYTPINQEREI